MDNAANIAYLSFLFFALSFLSRSSSWILSNANSCIRFQVGILIFILWGFLFSLSYLTQTTNFGVFHSFMFFVVFSLVMKPRLNT